MSTQSNIHDRNGFSTVKIEANSDEDLEEQSPTHLPNENDYSIVVGSTPISTALSSSVVYKGKIEVTSKGRRKIFDGVRWQILCRRPDCRKQTNKKSLCITHYKEEYELAHEPTPWSTTNVRSFPFRFYQTPSSSCNGNKTTITTTDIEDQNNTISTTNTLDNDDRFSTCNRIPSLLTKHVRTTCENEIKTMPDGRRYIFKSGQWQILCKYDNICRYPANHTLLCANHFKLAQQHRDGLVFHVSNHRRHRPSPMDSHKHLYSNSTSKQLRTNGEHQISSSPCIKQFNIHRPSERNDRDHLLLSSEVSDVKPTLSADKHDVPMTSSYCSFDSGNKQMEQSVQTDLSIPLCCSIHRRDHSFFVSCADQKTSNHAISLFPKQEPHC